MESIFQKYMILLGLGKLKIISSEMKNTIKKLIEEKEL